MVQRDDFGGETDGKVETPKGNCPFCNEIDEDTTHILECRAPLAVDLWEELQWTCIVGLYKIDTNSWMIMPLIRELDTLKFQNRQLPNILVLPDNIQIAIRLNRKLVGNFFERI